MKKKELKKKIREAYDSEAPDLLSRIKDSCSREAQIPAYIQETAVHQVKRPAFATVTRRLCAAAVCLLLFITGLSVGFFVPDEGLTVSNTDTFIYLDVNPSIELRLDKKDKVVDCIAANSDAEVILEGLKLRGVDVNTALTAIVGSMYVNGYLTVDSNSILVSVNTKDNARTETMLTDITKKINDVFMRSDLECSIIAQSVAPDDELLSRAESNGISVGKMNFVDKVVKNFDDFGEEDVSELTDMSIRELNLIYSTRYDDDEGNDDDRAHDKPYVSGDIGGYVKQDEALSTLLTAINTDIGQVEFYNVKAAYHRHEQSRQMFYHVTLKLKDSDTIYEFEVDCLTGEVIKTDSRIERTELPDGEDDRDDSPLHPEENEHVKH